MKNILLITTKYPCEKGQEWLTNELAESMHSEGNNISVIVLSWEYTDGASEIINIKGINVYRYRLWKWLYNKNFIISILKLFSFSLIGRIKSGGLIKKSDIIIATTPCISIWAFFDFFSNTKKAKKYLILWDFFPYYMKDLWGKRKNVLFNPLLRIENRLYNRFDVIGCMTSESINFLKKKYNIKTSKIKILPLWTKQLPKVILSDDKKTSIRRKYGIKESNFISIYGGAMSVVQGLDNIINLAAMLNDNSHYKFLFVGKGPELSRLKLRAQNEGLTNVVFIDFVPRDEYEEIIAASDLGIVSLSGNHSVPSFPSKSIDYLKVGLPILASIDKYTEFGKILVNDMKAGYWVEAGKPDLLAETLKKMSLDKDFLKECSLNGRQYYEQNMKVESATKNILLACEEV